MPGGNGTGPKGQGGAGRGPGGGAGPGGNCLCPNCKVSVPHRPGVPCNSMSCPKCGARMVRE